MAPLAKLNAFSVGPADGRKAKFADGHEESHPIVKTRDPDRINNLVNWILSLK